MRLIRRLFQKTNIWGKDKGGKTPPLKSEFQVTLSRLQQEYKDARETIEVEINRWHTDMDKIKSNQPNFQFSELKQLEDLVKQIDLILEELSQLDPKINDTQIGDIYVSDYVSMRNLIEKYKNIPDKNFSNSLCFNSFSSIYTLEAYLKKDYDYEYSADVLRIKERAEELGYSIDDKLKKAIIRGAGYNKVAGWLMRDLDVSFEHAKILVSTELRIAGITAKIHQAKRNGYTHMQRRSMRDKHVCDICKSLDGTIYRLDSITAKDVILHPNDRCTLVEVIVDEDGKVKRSPHYEEAQEFIKQRAIENAERARKIEEEYYKKHPTKKRK